MRPHRQQPTRLPCPWDSLGKDTRMGCHFLLQCMKVKSESEVAQSCPTLSYPMDCSLPGSSVHGIFQARVLEWGAIAFSAENIVGPCFKHSWQKSLPGVQPQVPQRIEFISNRHVKCFLTLPAPGARSALSVLYDGFSVPQECSTSNVWPEVPAGS